MPPKNKLSLAVQYPDPRLQDVATRVKLRRWIQAVLYAPAELTIRFVAADEGRALNAEYRDKDYATNVLTFAYSEDDTNGADSELTHADIILCTDVLQQEALEQKKSVEEHTAHLVIHGVLHAQGYDHETEEESGEMEEIEIEALAKFGFENPYQAR